MPNAHITPSLGGGNTVSTPGQGGTDITPSFGGGYTVSTPGQLNTHITPSFGGGYTVSKPGQGDIHITPSFGGGYTVCFAAVRSKTGSPNPESGNGYCYYFKPSTSTGKTLHHPAPQKSPNAN